MRSKLMVIVLLVLLQAGCAGGFRVGGNNVGAGIGAYIGPVPDALRQERSCSLLARPSTSAGDSEPSR